MTSTRVTASGKNPAARIGVLRPHAAASLAARRAKEHARSRTRSVARPRLRGLMLVDVMSSLAGLALAAAIALPVVGDFTHDARLLEPIGARDGFAALFHSADAPQCRVTASADGHAVRYTCAVIDFGQGFPAATTGLGRLAAYSFTLRTGDSAPAR